VSKITLSLDEVSQEFDTNEVFGFEVDDTIKEVFGERVRERIETRTLDGKSIHNRKFTKYSKEYAEAKGVSRDSVDMFLTGDMLETMEVEVNDTVKVKIADSETPKAFNHCTGDTLPTRNFFGINKKELNQIAKEIKEDFELQREREVDREQAEEIAKEESISLNLGDFITTSTTATTTTTTVSFDRLFADLFGDE
jgi:hypothetical protein